MTARKEGSFCRARTATRPGLTLGSASCWCASSLPWPSSCPAPSGMTPHAWTWRATTGRNRCRSRPRRNRRILRRRRSIPAPRPDRLRAWPSGRGLRRDRPAAKVPRETRAAGATRVSYLLSSYRGVAQLVARVVWDHQAAGSSPVTPTSGKLPLPSSGNVRHTSLPYHTTAKSGFARPGKGFGMQFPKPFSLFTANQKLRADGCFPSALCVFGSPRKIGICYKLPIYATVYVGTVSKPSKANVSKIAFISFKYASYPSSRSRKAYEDDSTRSIKPCLS